MFYVLCTFQNISSLFSIYCLWPYLSLYVRRLRNNSCDNLEPIWEYKRHKRWWYIKETVVGISYLDLNIHITQAMEKNNPRCWFQLETLGMHRWVKLLDCMKLLTISYKFCNQDIKHSDNNFKNYNSSQFLLRIRESYLLVKCPSIKLSEQKIFFAQWPIFLLILCCGSWKN